MRTILILLAVLAFSGCASRHVVVEDLKVPNLRVPPQEAMTRCETPLPLKDPSFASIIEKLKETIDLLGVCSSKREELQRFIDEDKK